MVDGPLNAPPVRFYRTKVFHARLRPVPHRFSYQVLSIVVDIDQLPAANRLSRWFSVDRFNLLGFSLGDHGPKDQNIRSSADLRRYVTACCIEGGINVNIGRIELLCFPRLLGKVFNPLSVYYCRDVAGIPVVLLYEVSNTFGQRHTYIVAVDTDGGHIAPHECDKLFYVSPFMDMAMRYRFRAEMPDEKLSLKIVERDADGVVLTALMSGEEFVPETGPLVRAALASPLMGFKVLAGIHWEAIKLLMKKYHIRPRPQPPAAISAGLPGPFSHITAQENQSK